jgi:hypothetical protein
MKPLVSIGDRENLRYFSVGRRTYVAKAKLKIKISSKPTG